VEQEEKAASEEEEDEPATKRGRKGNGRPPPKSKVPAAKKSSPPKPKRETSASPKPRESKKKSPSPEPETSASDSESLADDAEKEEDEPATKRGRKGNGRPPPKSKVPAAKKSSPPKPKRETSASPKPRESKKKSPSPEPEASASDSEGLADDAEKEEKVKKPAITAKARKKVQTKLISKGKDDHPYPDWPAGSPVPYAALCETFKLIEGTTKRLEKLSHTSLFLRQVLRLTPDELLLVIHLMINRLAADYEGVELGIGESLLMKAICDSCGRSMQKLKEDHKEIGDLGEVAMKSRNTQKTLFAPKSLTIKIVHAGLKEIATTQGQGGQGRKVSLINKLLSAAKGDEAKYLVRGLEGKLRLGLAEKTVIVALSQAVIVHEVEKQGEKTPSLEQMTAAEEMLKGVYSELPNYEIIIPEMMKGGIMNLSETCKLQPGVPLKPMLAKPTKAISEVLDRFENKRFTCEYKYDGERVQIHYVAPGSSTEFPTIDPEKGIAKIFSRNSEELSPKYPDILAALHKWIKPGVESFVLDCEAVAWDKDEKRLLPFQQLMTRKRKDVAVEDVKVKVCVFGFDFLFYNNKVPPNLPHLFPAS
jgi:DNA ligase-1